MNELIEKVLQWGIDKGITGPHGKGTPRAQANKMLEECNETRDAVIFMENFEPCKKPTQFKSDIEDGIGDVFVTGILLAEMYGMTAQQCLQAAYNVISKRSGTMIDGNFVKSEALIREDGRDDEFIIAHGKLMEEMLAKELYLTGPDDDLSHDLDDDLGELDSAKACKIDNADCESCS